MKKQVRAFYVRAIPLCLACVLSFMLATSLMPLQRAFATDEAGSTSEQSGAPVGAPAGQNTTVDDGLGADETGSGTSAGGEALETGVGAAPASDTVDSLAVSVLAVSDLLGSGTQEDPLRIYTGQDLYDFAVAFNAGQLPASMPTGSNLYLSLMNDIDLSQFGNWTPIGYYGTAGDRPFQGTFQSDPAAGTTYKVTGLTINTTIMADYMSYGLFGYAKDATFINVQVSASITAVDTSTPGYRYSAGGALAGRADDCTITGCTATGTVSITASGTNVYAGGLVGYAQQLCL